MISLQFSRAHGIGNDLIAWFGAGAGFAHVDVILSDGRLLGARHDALAGVPPGVQVRPADYHRFERTLHLDLLAGDSIRNAFLQAALTEVGKPYDTTAILAFAIGRDWRTPDSWFCSEFIGAMLEQALWFPDPLATPTSRLTPDGLLLAISARQSVDLRQIVRTA